MNSSRKEKRFTKGVIAMFLPIFLKRKNLIISKLKSYGASSPETALTLKEVGIINPDYFTQITDKLVETGIICRTKRGGYYVSKQI